MKKVLLVAFLATLMMSCGESDSEYVSVQIESFKLNQNCFSAIKLQQAEVLITNEEDYNLFEDSIRVNYFASCDTTHLPAVNFDSSFFIGKYTQTSGCSVYYESIVKFYSESSLYEYITKVTSNGTCEKLNSAFNCAVVPRLSSQINVDMSVEYLQE